ncbi:hypothetical protein [Alcaligenes faecalis]|nr:hypothetical protein [Alcaligenes faecalis]
MDETIRVGCGAVIMQNEKILLLKRVPGPLTVATQLAVAAIKQRKE